MTPIEISNSLIVIKKFNLFKFNREFEILESESEEVVMRAVERRPGIVNKVFRFLSFGGMTPFAFDFVTTAGERLFAIERGFTWFASTIVIANEKNSCIGILKENWYSPGLEKFKLLDTSGGLIFSIKVDTSTFNYKLVTDASTVYSRVIRDSVETEKRMKEIYKKRSPLSAVYFLTINSEMPPNQLGLMLLFSSVIGLDLTLMRRLNESSPTG